MKNKIHLLPNIITAFGLSCGLFVIFKISILDTPPSAFAIIYSAALLLFLAAIADVLDGAVARLTNNETQFGKIFDSISDAITFGIAPPIVILQTFPSELKEAYSLFITISAMIFSFCGALRLVRYSVAKAPPSEEQQLILDKNFTGLPIPAAASILISTALFIHTPTFTMYFSLSPELFTWIHIIIMIMLGYLMISRLKFPSLKALKLRVLSIQTLFVTAVFIAFLIYGTHQHFPLMFVSFSWFYLLLSLILSSIRLIAGNKSKTLEDFALEPDDLD